MTQRPRRQEWSTSWCMNYLFEFLLGILESNGNFTLYILQLSLQKRSCCFPVFQKQCSHSRYQLLFSNSLSCLNGSGFQSILGTFLSSLIEIKWHYPVNSVQKCFPAVTLNYFLYLQNFKKTPTFFPLWLIVKLRSVLSLC